MHPHEIIPGDGRGYMWRAHEQAMELRDRGALFYVSHSGGKDSQAQLIEIRRWVPDDQIVLVHCDIYGFEHHGCVAHIEATAPGLPLIVCRQKTGAGEPKTMFAMIDMNMARFARKGKRSNPWPDPGTRQCTSDLKRGAIRTAIRQHLMEVNGKSRRGGAQGLVVDCIGIRSAESGGRKWGLGKKNKPSAFKRRTDQECQGREWYQWYPVHDWSVPDVFAAIADAGQEPHWTYAAGLERCSCVFCIFSSREDCQKGALLRPDLFEGFVEKEREVGFSYMPLKKGRRVFLEDYSGIDVDVAKRAHATAVAKHRARLEKPSVESVRSVKVQRYDDNEWHVEVDGEHLGTLERGWAERFSTTHGYVRDRSKPLWTFTGEIEWSREGGTFHAAKRELVAALTRRTQNPPAGIDLDHLAPSDEPRDAVPDAPSRGDAKGWRVEKAGRGRWALRHDLTGAEDLQTFASEDDAVEALQRVGEHKEPDEAEHVRLFASWWA